jgi:hypothetical protein
MLLTIILLYFVMTRIYKVPKQSMLYAVLIVTLMNLVLLFIQAFLQGWNVPVVMALLLI